MDDWSWHLRPSGLKGLAACGLGTEKRMFQRKALVLAGTLEVGPTFSGLPSEGEGRRKWEEKEEGKEGAWET